MKQHISERPGGRHANAVTGAVLVGQSGSRIDQGVSVAHEMKEGIELVQDGSPRYEPPEEYFNTEVKKYMDDMPLCTETRVDGNPCVQKGQPLNGRCLGHQLKGSQKGLKTKQIYSHYEGMAPPI